jgi:predicted transposase/invertase (TIGR01784 family)
LTNSKLYGIINKNLFNKENTMSKNDCVATTLNNTETCIKDESFKDIARYKCSAALLIKFAIPEFMDVPYEDIVRAIIDERERGNMTYEDILQDEIDSTKTEIGTGKEKNTINDVVFSIKRPNSNDVDVVVFQSKLTINFEMQSTTSRSALGYDITQRAIYYAASLLRETVPAGDSKYTNIHKVYTIWFCDSLLGINKTEEAVNEFIHYYEIRRCYPHIRKTGKDENADLMSAVMVELPLLKKHLDNDIYRAVYKLFYDTRSSVTDIETISKINLTKFKRKVADRMDWDLATKQYGEKERETGVEIGTERGLELAIKVIQLNKAGIPAAAIAKKLNITESKVRGLIG